MEKFNLSKRVVQKIHETVDACTRKSRWAIDSTINRQTDIHMQGTVIFTNSGFVEIRADRDINGSFWSEGLGNFQPQTEGYPCSKSALKPA
jgi:hypothetical protein